MKINGSELTGLNKGEEKMNIGEEVREAEVWEPLVEPVPRRESIPERRRVEEEEEVPV